MTNHVINISHDLCPQQGTDCPSGDRESFDRTEILHIFPGSIDNKSLHDLRTNGYFLQSLMRMGNGERGTGNGESGTGNREKKEYTCCPFVHSLLQKPPDAGSDRCLPSAQSSSPSIARCSKLNRDGLDRSSSPFSYEI